MFLYPFFCHSLSEYPKEKLPGVELTSFRSCLPILSRPKWNGSIQLDTKFSIFETRIQVVDLLAPSQAQLLRAQPTISNNKSINRDLYYDSSGDSLCDSNSDHP